MIMNTEVSRYEKRWIEIIAVLLFLLGFINTASSLFSFNMHRIKLLQEVFSYQFISGTRALVVVAGIVSFITAPALYRRKRVAWYIAVVILAGSGIAHIIKGADIEEASFCILILGALLPMYRYCNVKSDPIRTVQSTYVIGAAVIFVSVYTFAGVYVFAGSLGTRPEEYPTWQVALNALLFNVSDLQPYGKKAEFFIDSLIAINSFALISGLTLSLSPVLARRIPQLSSQYFIPLVKEKAEQAIQVLTLEPKYQHFYLTNDEGEGVISYTVVNRAALAIGNPVTTMPLESFASEWIAYCESRDWIPSAYQAAGEFAAQLKKRGFSSVPCGVEAVIELESFSLEGKAMQGLRTARNKAQKDGWTCRTFTDEDWPQVKRINEMWLNMHGGKENSFAMGAANPGYMLDTKATLLFDGEGKLLAFQNNIELPARKMRSIDLMRRDPDAPKGAMEYLFLHEILKAKDEGLLYYDLGYSPLAMVENMESDDQFVSKLFTLIYNNQKRIYDFKGLHFFKSRFHPAWETSYLIYPSRFDMPAVLLALLRLNSGR